MLMTDIKINKKELTPWWTVLNKKTEISNSFYNFFLDIFIKENSSTSLDIIYIMLNTERGMLLC